MNVHSITVFQPMVITYLKKLRVRGISNNNNIATMFIFGNDGIFKYHNKSFFGEECDLGDNNALIVKYEEDLLW